MVDGDWFDELEKVARTVRRSNKPFGGIQLIVCGDFLQLPPVTKKDQSKSYAFAASSWKRCIDIQIELQEVHRQNNPEFIDLLRRIRLGECTASDAATLCGTSLNEIEFGDIVATKLCTHVRDADTINASSLRSLRGEIRKFVSRDEYGGSNAAYKQLDGSVRAPQVLEIKVGAQVMCKSFQTPSFMCNSSIQL